MAIGESVHLIGVAYAEPEVLQKVYSGTVTERGYGDRFRYTISPHVDIRGFSGAPIVDDAGLVVGVMTVWFHPKMDGGTGDRSGRRRCALRLEGAATLDNEPMRHFFNTCVVVACVLFAIAARGENWPQFRGPKGLGYTDEQRSSAFVECEDGREHRVERAASEERQSVVITHRVG